MLQNKNSLNISTELLHWVAVWVVGFGALAIVIVMTNRNKETKLKVNRFTLGLLLIAGGTIIYLNSSSLLFIMDDYESACKEIEANADQVLNCVNDKQRIAKWEAFLMGFFASITILVGTIIVAVSDRKS